MKTLRFYRKKRLSSLLASWIVCPLIASFTTVSLAASAQTNTCQANANFNVGAGIYDITGPAAEQRMMGYAMIYQQTAGIQQRLWARAFVIESPCNGKRVVFVNTDLCQVFQAVKQQVMKKLHAKYGNLYTDDNVLLTATHTHSGPGGFSTYNLYNLTTLGFDRQHFDAIVDGIVAAIDRAHSNVTPAQIKIIKGQLKGINFNRSPESYLLDPQSERNRYAGNTDTEMTLIRFDSLAGKPIGMINWFPIHGVSLNNKNDLISGDNKGYAEYRFEQDFHSDYGPHAFVAAFAQANAGDVSPNLYGHEGGNGLAGIAAVEKAGEPQYKTAKQLYDSATEVVTGGIDYRHRYVAMDKVAVDATYTDGKVQTTCPAAIGVSMLAGTQDGEGVGWQGVTCDTLGSVVPHAVCAMTTNACQGVKPIALATGSMLPYPWTPNILPLQVMRVGTLVIAAAPVEITTMTGRRIKERVAAQLPKDNQVVLSALSNAYAGYVATNQEYQLQRYEGASTHFGPWEEAALQQELGKLAKALTHDEPLSVTGLQPPDLLDKQVNLQPGVVYDDKPAGKQFGDVYQDVNAVYKPGDTVQAVFWGAHPKNNYRDQDTFLTVEHLEHGQWVVVRRDRDWDTEYHWQRSGLSSSLVTVVWRMPADVAPGQYRIVQYGDWKALFTGKITPYVGYSSVFKVG